MVSALFLLRLRVPTINRGYASVVSYECTMEARLRHPVKRQYQCKFLYITNRVWYGFQIFYHNCITTDLIPQMFYVFNIQHNRYEFLVSESSFIHSCSLSNEAIIGFCVVPSGQICSYNCSFIQCSFPGIHQAPFDASGLYWSADNCA